MYQRNFYKYLDIIVGLLLALLSSIEQIYKSELSNITLSIESNINVDDLWKSKYKILHQGISDNGGLAESLSPRYFEPPYFPYKPFSYKDTSKIRTYEFLPESYISHSKEHLSDLYRSISLGRYECYSNEVSKTIQECTFLVRGDHAILSLDERILKSILECNITKINNQFGAPYNCRPVVINTNSETWILASVTETKNSQPAPCMGRSDWETRAIGYNAHSIINAIGELLNSIPFELQVSTRENSSNTIIEATNSFRKSSILPGWRELITIRIDIYEEWDVIISNHDSRARGQDSNNSLEKKLKSIALDIATTLYVSKLNNYDRSEWHLPSEEQERIYVQTIIRLINQRILSLCNNQIIQMQKIKGTVIRCGQQ